MFLNRSKFFNVLDNIQQSEPQKKLVNEFLSCGSSYEKYVIGRNQESNQIIKNFEINGIIDDFTNQKTWMGLPIIKSELLPAKVIVINCSTSISPIDVNKKLLDNSFENILSYHDIWFYYRSKLKIPWFVNQMHNSYNKFSDNFYNTYELFYDNLSRKIYLDLLKYRITGNINLMENYEVRTYDQYFESFMNYNNEIFVDAGGFDGDTTYKFCKRYSNYKFIHFFEPSKKNMILAKNKLKEIKRINYYERGLSNKSGAISFNSDAGSAASIDPNNETDYKIDVSTLDLIVKEPVSFIKMDLEGWELNALKGSKKHIINDHPKLAIAVYHKAQDFFEIPKYILSLNNQYHILLRHYTQGWSETIMYFLPI